MRSWAILTSPFIMRTLASHQPQGSCSLALERIWLWDGEIKGQAEKETSHWKKKKRCVCLTYLHLLALSNLLLGIDGRWHPDVIKGHLAFWLPAENKMTVYNPLTWYLNILFTFSTGNEQEKLTLFQRQWWELHRGCLWQSPDNRDNNKGRASEPDENDHWH